MRDKLVRGPGLGGSGLWDTGWLGALGVQKQSALSAFVLLRALQTIRKRGPLRTLACHLPENEPKTMQILVTSLCRLP